MNSTIKTILTDLRQRSLPGGGFEEHPSGGYRPDATAWATLALSAVHTNHEFINPALLCLAQSQLADGRIPLSLEYPRACWPTPIAALAWANAPRYQQAFEQAISFLLKFSGTHGESPPNSPLAHNSALRGWPWIADTHSWVEPTSLAVIALRLAGRGDHPRVTEAIEMLLDRQLPGGGWNYGNTMVYGQELRPMPDSTGLALLALSGLFSERVVARSIEYLSETVQGIRAPFSLAWGLLGLRAWQHPPETAEDLIDQCLDRRYHHGGFSTTQLCLLLLAHPDMAESSIFRMRGAEFEP
jgi:hypothetical protein